MVESDDEKDDEKEEFIKQFKKDVVRLEKVSPLLKNDALREKIGIFYNAYYSDKLARLNQYLVYLTFVLAAASVLQTINFIYGQQVATTTIDQIIELVRSLLTLFLLIVSIKVGLEILRDAFRQIKKRLGC